MPRFKENMNYVKNMGQMIVFEVSTPTQSISLSESILFVDESSTNFL